MERAPDQGNPCQHVGFTPPDTIDMDHHAPA